jgi:hypothetical protein
MWAGHPYLGTMGGHFLLFRWSCHFHSLFARIQLSFRFFTNDYFKSFSLHNDIFRFRLFELSLSFRIARQTLILREERSAFARLQSIFVAQTDSSNLWELGRPERLSGLPFGRMGGLRSLQIELSEKSGLRT